MKWHPATELQFLKGVGPKYADFLRRKGLFTFKDLIEFYPRTYQDQSYGKSIKDLKEGETVSLNLTVVGVKKNSFSPYKNSRLKSMTTIILTDGESNLDAKFFKAPYRGYFNQFEPQAKVRATGKVKIYKNKLEIHHPDLVFLKEDQLFDDEKPFDGLVPVYSESERLSQKKIHELVKTAFKLIEDESRNTVTSENPWMFSSVPGEVLKKYKLLDKWKSIKELHFPSGTDSRAYNDLKTDAHKSLIFEELFTMELLTALRKQNTVQEIGPSMSDVEKSVEQFLKKIPFKLTGDQLQSLKEISEDLTKSNPMHRLVQGDVGSGKTLVALASAQVVLDNGLQVALMAPTEILAEQHYENARKFYDNVILLTGKTKTKDRAQIHERLLKDEPCLVIGTHALFEDKVKFNHLGLVIVDEQHRFGVYQRQRLKAKGRGKESPHFLVMTATPIPRTLTMTVYGDLDVSVIEEMPPGRSPIDTKKFTQADREKVLEKVLAKLKAGDQAYFVFPLVSESETLDLKSAEYEYELLSDYFADYKVGLLHGKMKPQEKEEIMNSFRKNEIQVLVSTTVIEVGVDVPNATVMVIENCERFGLSQLHQLRGRVGRGSKPGSCYLILGNKYSKESYYRASVMESTTNGFKIAEEDLLIRGPGEVLGTRQSGLPDFKLANLLTHQKTLMAARKIAFEIVNDPKFSLHIEKVKAEHAHKFELTKIG